MILDYEIKKNSYGNIDATRSTYIPGQDVKDLTEMIMNHFEVGYQIMNKPYNEFNGLTVIERQNKDQKKWNNFQSGSNEDPQQEWHSDAIRPIIRNKVISITAHITASLIFPQIFAQNDMDEEDKDAAQVMRKMMEWRADQADYEKTFLYAVISALINPAVIVHTEFARVMRTIKERGANGELTKKEILDELYSGYQDNLVPVDELFIGNIYESNIQKQPFLIWRKVIDYADASEKYAGVKNFKKYVEPGIQNIFSEDTNSFYKQYDDELGDRLVEEVTYYNRTLDLQVVLVNGVLMTDVDEPNPRNDKSYPFAKTGHETFDEGKFFYYMSLVNKMTADSDIIDIMYRMVIDGTFLSIMPPMALFGEEATGNLIMPGAVSSFENENAKLQPVNTGANLTAGINTLNILEASANESSQSPAQAGQSIKGQQTAFEIAQLEKNAKINLGLFGKMIGFLVKDLGELFVSDLLQFQTVGEVMELTDGGTAVKFRKMLVNTPGESTTVIDFDMEQPEMMTEEEELSRSFSILENDEDGDLKSNKTIFKVNPDVFRRIKYLIKIVPDTITPPSDNLKKAINLELYDRAIANPLANQEEIYKDFLLSNYDSAKSDVDKYVRSQAPQQSPQQGKAGNPVASVASAEKMSV